MAFTGLEPQIFNCCHWLCWLLHAHQAFGMMVCVQLVAASKRLATLSQSISLSQKVVM
jgi:hypothetical protein